MKKILPSTPDTAPGNTTAANIVDKKGFAAHWLFSPRKVDNLIADGLPHLKIGSRRVRILVDEADKWMLQKYGTQRRRAVRETAPMIVG